jgi:hypothetical protein
VTTADSVGPGTRVWTWAAEHAASTGQPVSVAVLCETAMDRLGVSGVTVTVEAPPGWPETRYATDQLGARLAEPSSYRGSVSLSCTATPRHQPPLPNVTNGYAERLIGGVGWLSVSCHDRRVLFGSARKKERKSRIGIEKENLWERYPQWPNGVRVPTRSG